MNKRHIFQAKHISVRLVFLFLIVIPIHGCGLETHGYAEVEIINASNMRISSLKISVLEDGISLQNLDPQQRTEVEFSIKHDAHYIVQVLFENGSSLHKELGYLTQGLNVKDKIIVNDSDISLERLYAKTIKD